MSATCPVCGLRAMSDDEIEESAVGARIPLDVCPGETEHAEDAHQVDLFLAAAPEIPFTREHAESIAAHCRAQGIPFCATCRDWHWPADEHTHREESGS